MLTALKKILEIQELDTKMIRLMRLKRDRQKELNDIDDIKSDLRKQIVIKETEVLNLKRDLRIMEGEVSDIKEDIKKYEEQQNEVRKIEDFNALTQQISAKDRDRHNREQKMIDVQEKLAAEEEVLGTLRETLESTSESSKVIEGEIKQSISLINEEGQQILNERQMLVKDADPEVFSIYERLLKNKKDRVVVPLEDRTCSGCHIMVTAQHENLVRKGEKLHYCEHCSRIHYWQESADLEGTGVATKRRRRKSTATQV
ncbi:MAG: hypothetical protein CMO81_03590 [Waddliaceae bacterium]|nr:hypothetical protein [Waddliaceae bacterium]